MEKKLLWRILLIIAVVGLASYSLYPPRERINLGLDLRGGIHLVLQVQTGDAIKAELDDAARRLISVAEEEGVTLGDFEVDAEGDVGAYWGLWDKDGNPKYG